MGIVRALRDSAPGIGRQAQSGTQQPAAIPSDAQLVAAAQSGASWAHEALFRRYARMASGLAYRLVAGTDIQVDDVVQDAFIAAFERLETLRAPEALPSWLGAIVLRQSSKRLRRHRLRVRFGIARRDEFNPELALSSEAPPDVAASLRQAYSLLHRLKPDERLAFLLRRVEGLTVAEMAQQMDTSLSTVKRRLHLAEKRLERSLLGAGPFPVAPHGSSTTSQRAASGAPSSTPSGSESDVATVAQLKARGKDVS